MKKEVSIYSHKISQSRKSKKDEKARFTDNRCIIHSVVKDKHMLDSFVYYEQPDHSEYNI